MTARQSFTGRRLCAACCWLPLLLAGAVHAEGAADLSERSRHKSAVEAERADLRHKLNALKRDISKTETAQDSAINTLAQSEEAISSANRALRELAAEQQQAALKLRQLSQEQARLAAAVAQQQKRLATLVRQQYVAGNEDRIKLLLSGDNPNRINRDLQYMGYVSQAQAKLITTLRTSQAELDGVKTETLGTRRALTEIEQEERANKLQLEQEKARHAQLLLRLSTRLSMQRQEAGRLQRDEQRLGGLVEQLAKLIEEQKKEQKKADAEALEKRRQQQARLRAEQEKQRSRQAAGSTPGKTVNPNAIDDDEPPKTLARNDLTPDNSHGDIAFASLRGKLRLPVQGTVSAKYGSARADGPSWKGLFIRTAEGAEIKAVASGKVIFAEWLRGFGNLLIIDHGGQYMTIYGNNQSLFKHAGDAVRGGDVIASAGNTGGNEKSGLYFEMRHQGRAFDPSAWVTFR